MFRLCFHFGNAPVDPLPATVEAMPPAYRPMRCSVSAPFSCWSHWKYEVPEKLTVRLPQSCFGPITLTLMSRPEVVILFRLKLVWTPYSTGHGSPTGLLAHPTVVGP